MWLRRDLNCASPPALWSFNVGGDNRTTCPKGPLQTTQSTKQNDHHIYVIGLSWCVATTGGDRW
jgi:hypothetical protein